jgi:ribosomal protein S12 methylthiotransferase accessory factor YcaO
LPETSLGSFSSTRKSLWIESQDLLQNEATWLPYELVHTDYTHPVTPQYGCFACSTKHLASGSHLLEASCHAICEVIERDAISVWHHLPSHLRKATRVTPESIADRLLDFADLRKAVGFDAYYEAEKSYSDNRG